MEDLVRTTQEQLSAHPLGEALSAVKLVKKQTVKIKPFAKVYISE